VGTKVIDRGIARMLHLVPQDLGKLIKARVCLKNRRAEILPLEHYAEGIAKQLEKLFPATQEFHFYLHEKADGTVELLTDLPAGEEVKVTNNSILSMKFRKTYVRPHRRRGVSFWRKSPSCPSTYATSANCRKMGLKGF